MRQRHAPARGDRDLCPARRLRTFPQPAHLFGAAPVQIKYCFCGYAFGLIGVVAPCKEKRLNRRYSAYALADYCHWLGLRMTRKRDVLRPYPPDYVSAETLGYRLDTSRSTIDDWVKRGLLPQPQTVGTMQRWRWSDVEACIHAANHSLAVASGNGFADEDADPFSQGAQNVATTHA